MEKRETPVNAGTLSGKAVSVVSGEAHTIALSGDGSVYAWGRGMFGRLGTGREADELFPVKLKFGSPETNLNFVGTAAGAYHSLALADDGSVWCWGYNFYGQLGGNGENCVVPQVLEPFLESSTYDSVSDLPETKGKPPHKIQYVKAGGMMSLAIDNVGSLYMWGNCPHPSTKPEEDGFPLVSITVPTLVRDFVGRRVVKVACGNEHVIALVSARETYNKGEEGLISYSWGSNSHGQLGLGDKENRHHPHIIETFNEESPWAVYEVACGAYHTALLTRNKKKQSTDMLESVCWTFGLGENGQLGHGTVNSESNPKWVDQLPDSMYLVSVDCGLFHTSVVSSGGDVWSWGMEKGLGLCPDARFSGGDSGDAVFPLQILCNGLAGPRFRLPVQIACGAAHTVLVADDGYRIWAWGRGRSGVLGNGRTVDFLAPTAVLWPPLGDDPAQEEPNNAEKESKTEIKDSERVAEEDKRLSMAMEEMKILQERLYTMERYASILHGSVFGKPLEERDIPVSLKDRGVFDISRVWEELLESADRSQLVRMEKFYRNMLAGIKDKILKRRIQELIHESLHSSTSGT